MLDTTILRRDADFSNPNSPRSLTSKTKNFELAFANNQRIRGIAPGVRLDSEWKNPSSLTDTAGVVPFPSGDGDSGSVGGPLGNNFVFKFNILPADFNRDTVVDAADFVLWNSYKFTNTNSNQNLDDEFRRGDATGDGVIDGQDFHVWNTLKFTTFVAWSGAVANNPSASWLSSYNSLLQQYQIYQNGQINTSLSFSTWDAFANDLLFLFSTL